MHGSFYSKLRTTRFTGRRKTIVSSSFNILYLYLMLFMESEAEMQHDVGPRKEFDDEGLVMAIGHVAEHADLAAIAQLLVNGNSPRDRL